MQARRAQRSICRISAPRNAAKLPGCNLYIAKIGDFGPHSALSYMAGCRANYINIQ